MASKPKDQVRAGAKGTNRARTASTDRLRNAAMDPIAERSRRLDAAEPAPIADVPPTREEAERLAASAAAAIFGPAVLEPAPNNHADPPSSSTPARKRRAASAWPLRSSPASRRLEHRAERHRPGRSGSRASTRPRWCWPMPACP